METIRRIPYYGGLFLLAYMPFHIFLSQSLSLAIGGLDAWKIGKDVLTFGLVVLSVGTVFYFKKADDLYKKILGLSLLYLLIHLVVYLFNKDQATPEIAVLATIYNNRLLWYLLIGLSASRLWPKTINYQKLIKWILVISSIVCLLGVIQYFLPKDILSHVGYSIDRGVKPAFFIDDKPDLPRIISTLRDPNSLGAYLILPITLIVGLIFKNKLNRTLLVGLLGLHSLVLFLTFSRSAWLGTVLAASLLLAVSYRLRLNTFFKKFWLIFMALLIVLAIGIYETRDQYFVQNVISHSDENTLQQGSTQKHLSLAEQGVKGIVKRPLGHGPGTAGLVAISNPRGGLLTENYFIQIGHEVGIIGLSLFIVLNILVYKRLQRNSTLGLALITSFWGLLLCNMLLHTWSNEAVALQWWLLAGLSLKN